MSHDCGNDGSSKCEAHEFVMEIIKELKEVNARKDIEFGDLKENLTILTQNMLESQRVSRRMDDIIVELRNHDSSQDIMIGENNKFIIKIGAVLATISMLATLLPLLEMFK